MYDSAFVAAKFRQIEDLSGSRASDLRTVNCLEHPIVLVEDFPDCFFPRLNREAQECQNYERVALQLIVIRSDIPRIQTRSSLGGQSYIRKGAQLHNSASVAVIIRHFEDLSDSRVSDLRTVNCNYSVYSVRKSYDIHNTAWLNLHISILQIYS
jgi:hypothetical protein